MKVIIILVFALFASMACIAQSADTLSIVGITFDADSTSLLTNTTVSIKKRVMACDQTGRFVLNAQYGDTLVFRHIGFCGATIVIADTMDINSIVAVFMHRDTVQLPEVIVRPRYDRLAEMSRFMPVTQTPQQIYANQNVSRCTYTALTQRATNSWDASQNQQMTIGNYQTELEYKGMVNPSQMVSFGTAGIALIVSLIKKAYSDETITPHSQPLSPAEVNYLLRLYNHQNDK